MARYIQRPENALKRANGKPFAFFKITLLTYMQRHK